MSDRPLGPTTLTVLAALAAGYRWGFDVMDATGLASGSVYRALGRLEELSFVVSEWEDAEEAVVARRPRRRYYLVTPEGERALAAARERSRLFALGGLPILGTGA